MKLSIANAARIVVFLSVYATAGLGQVPVAQPDGYAAQNGGTTGGGAATPTTVSTAAAFKSAIKNDDPAVIVVKGKLNVGPVDIGSNKTIIGADVHAGLSGGTIKVRGRNNIFQNLTIGPAKGDAMELSGAKNVFITKCEFHDSSETSFLCLIFHMHLPWTRFKMSSVW